MHLNETAAAAQFISFQFMSLFQISNVQVNSHACTVLMFNFTLPSVLIEKRSNKFSTAIKFLLV